MPFGSSPTGPPGVVSSILIFDVKCLDPGRVGMNPNDSARWRTRVILIYCSQKTCYNLFSKQ